MPKSKKRVKKPQQEEAVPKSRNIVKSGLGKTIIIILSAGFVLSVLISTIFVVIKAIQA